MSVDVRFLTYEDCLRAERVKQVLGCMVLYHLVNCFFFIGLNAEYFNSKSYNPVITC